MLSNRRQPLYILIILSLLFVGFSCGGSGGGSDLFAGGGISGTGKYTGVISGFGSIFLGGIEFDTTSASIIVEGRPATENDLSVGMKVTLTASNTIAEEIDFEPELKGTVTSIDSASNIIKVLEQPVQITSATVISGFSTLADLSIGDHLLVSGFFDSTNKVVATYVRLLPQQPSEVKIKGFISNLNTQTKTFEVNTLIVDYSKASINNQLSNGSFIVIKGTYSQGILTATSIEVTVPAVNASPGDTMKIEGIITAFNSITDFSVNGFPVVTDANTQYKNGSPSELAPDVWVEVKGTVNTNGTLLASTIEFRFNEKHEIELKGTLDDVNHSMSTLIIFGKSVKVSSSTIFKDDSSQGLQNFTFSHLSAGDYVEIGGFVNNSGELIATKIERMDPSGENLLKGPVTPYSKDTTPGNYSVGILGLTVDLNNPSATFEDINENSVDVTTFLNSIDDTKSPGDIVEAEGVYSATDGRFYATKAKIEKIN